ncbi:MAG: non-homologous end-joining DNA ligase [Pseudonocardiaceae bacterium]
MMASLGAAPGGSGWAFEWKWDGVRAIVAAIPGLVRATSRNGRDITAGYPELDVLAELVDRPVLLDGELVTLDQHGRPDFGRLQSRMHVRRPSPALVRSAPVQFYIFDVLHLDGPLLAKPYVQRRELLDQLQLTGGPVGIPANHTGIAASVLLDLACQHGLEGVVAKWLDSRYEPGRRARTWIKTPLRHTQEVIIGGWRPGEGHRAGTIGALLLGVYDETGQLRYAGDVGTGFTDRMLRDLLAMLSSHARSTSPFDDVVPREHARGTHWTEPDLVGEVEYRQWTADGRLRHASWRGLRPDRSPREIVLPGPRRSLWPPQR